MDVGRQLDDLVWCVALHVCLGLQHNCACFHQHIGELLGYSRRAHSLQGHVNTCISYLFQVGLGISPFAIEVYM